MIRSLGISTAVGAVVFGIMMTLILWDAWAFVPSLLAGALIGCVAGLIGEFAFWWGKWAGHGDRLGCVLRVCPTDAAGVLGIVAGGILGFLSYLFVGSVVNYLDPQNRFPGDIAGTILMFLGALLALHLSRLHASGAASGPIRYWLKTKGRR